MIRKSHGWSILNLKGHFRINFKNVTSNWKTNWSHDFTCRMYKTHHTRANVLCQRNLNLYLSSWESQVDQFQYFNLGSISILPAWFSIIMTLLCNHMSNETRWPLLIECTTGTVPGRPWNIEYSREWVTDLNDEQLKGYQIRWFEIQGIYAAFFIPILDNAIY